MQFSRLVGEVVIEPLDLIIRALQDNLGAGGCHNSEQAVGIDNLERRHPSQVRVNPSRQTSVEILNDLNQPHDNQKEQDDTRCEPEIVRDPEDLGGRSSSLQKPADRFENSVVKAPDANGECQQIKKRIVAGQDNGDL